MPSPPLPLLPPPPPTPHPTPVAPSARASHLPAVPQAVQEPVTTDGQQVAQVLEHREHSCADRLKRQKACHVHQDEHKVERCPKLHPRPPASECGP
eukprot:365213-Chlamydomonas_euryale.AAC.12